MTTTPAPSIAASPLTGTATGPFPTGFKYGAAAEVRVYLELAGVRQPDLTLDTDYTVTGATPLVDGGTVTLDASVVPADGWDEEAGDRVVILRRTVKSQALALPNAEGHKPKATEAVLDKLMRAAEEGADQLERAATTPAGEAGVQFPPKAKRRAKLLAFSDTEDAYPIPASSDLADVAADLDRSEAARDVAIAKAAVATAQAVISTEGAATSTAQAALAEAARLLAEAYLAALADNGSYETDADGRLAVLDGEEYWLRTVDGSKLRTKVDASTSTDWLDPVDGEPFIMLTLNGSLKRERNISCYSPADGLFNSYELQPSDPRIDLTKFSDRYDVVKLNYRCPKPNTAGSGSVSLTLNNGDGTFMWTRAIVKKGLAQLAPGDHAEGDHLTLEILLAAEDAGQRFLWLMPPDAATKKLTRLAYDTGQWARLCSPARPIKYGQVDANAWQAVMRPPPGAYLNGASKRSTDKLFVDIFDMGTFQADDPSLTLQGYGSDFAVGGLDETCNLRFGEVDGGFSTTNGNPSSTFCSVVFTGEFSSDDDPLLGKFPAQGRGHGFCRENVDTVILMRNDNTTARVVSAATKANPVVLEVAGSGMTLTAGMKIALQGVVGMTELNGVVTTLASVVGTTVTTDIDGSAFTDFVSHGGSIDLHLTLDGPTFEEGFKYGDRLTVNSTLLLEAPSADGLSTVIPARAWYDRTLEPNEAGFIRIETRFDPDDADTTPGLTTGLKRAVMLPTPMRNVDRMRVRRAGVWDATVYEIGQGDGTSAGYGKAEVKVCWLDDAQRRLLVLVNNLGYGVAGDANSIFSHWEDSGAGRVSIVASNDGYVARNNWGPKDNDGIIEYADPRDMSGIQWGADYSIAVFEAKLSNEYVLDDALADIDALINGGLAV